jgi:hypothetical protein
MPPRSYIITAIVLAVLVAISFPVTLGFSIILWYWLFAAAACILAVAGSFKIASGLGAPLWIGVALASPGFVWAADKLFEMMSSTIIHPVIWSALAVAARLTLLAAAAGALRLVETMSRSRAVFRVGYALLAASALLVGVGLVTYAMGWIIAKNALYAKTAQAVGVAAILVEYGAIIAAAVLITVRHGIERWTGAAISLISAYLLYTAVRSMILVEFPSEGPMFWLQPIVMLVGGAAVWRMGSVLCAQTHSERSEQSLAIANSRPSSAGLLLGLLMVVVVVIGGVALVMAGDKYHWGWTEIPVHYRLSFGVEVGGNAYTGASVVQVTYEQVPGWQAWAWIDAPPGGSIYRGQAATLRLPDGKVLCLMTSGQTLVGRKTRNSYAGNVVGIANRLLAPLLRSGDRRDMIDTSNAARISGSADIPLSLLPTILLIEKPEDPRSVHVFDPERPEQWLGSGARFLGAQIAVTSEPLTTGIAAVLPWLADRAVPQRLTSRIDPFYQESGGNVLFKAYFN